MEENPGNENESTKGHGVCDGGSEMDQILDIFPKMWRKFERRSYSEGVLAGRTCDSGHPIVGFYTRTSTGVGVSK